MEEREERYVILMEPPSDNAVLEELRFFTKKFGKRTLRKASNHVELVILTRRPLELLEEIMNRGLVVREVRNVDQTPPSCLEDALLSYVYFMWTERYWEAHEALENIWRQNKDNCLAGLINLAAALVKLQEGNIPSHVRIVRRAVKLLETCRNRRYIDHQCISDALKKALEEGGKPRLHLCLREAA